MNNSKLIEQNKNSIILLDIQIPQENNQNKVSIRGTGFIISKEGKFITSAHVYKQIAENELQYLGAMIPVKTDEKRITSYKRFKIELLDIDEENDISLMKLKTEQNTNFKTIVGFGDSESVKEGDEVMFVGYPLATELIAMGFGITMSSNKCIISSIKKRQDGSLHFFMVDTHINNGSSGSPVFLLKTGKAIGIAGGKISTRIPAPDGHPIDIPANMGICRPSNYIGDLINKNN